MNGLKSIQEHSKHGNIRKEKTSIMSLNMSLNTILSTYIVLEREQYLPSRSECIRLIARRPGPAERYDYWLPEYLPIIPQKSATTSFYPFFYFFGSSTSPQLTLLHRILPIFVCFNSNRWGPLKVMNNLGVVVVVDLKDAGQELSAFEVFTLVYLGMFFKK